MVYTSGGILMITNYYDGSLEKDETKQYKLIKKVSDNGTLFFFFI